MLGSDVMSIGNTAVRAYNYVGEISRNWIFKFPFKKFLN